ncbi:MAG TPA: DUF58 domain-containing protein [Acidimicrobiales bacterium]|nr:DUF58 domain-containing protein [Acidimicrobiales bacterium]
MLTRPGWLCLWGGVALVVAARLLGIAELYVFGAVVLGLVAGAIVYVRLIRLDLQIDRSVHPSHVHAGQLSRVEVRIRNVRRSATPVLRLRDPVSGTAGADLLVPPLDQGAMSTASYRLPTDRRGIVRVGPLRVVVGDPFGLAQASAMAAPQVEVTVYPVVEDIRPVPYTSGTDPLAGTLHPHAIGRVGDDFYALRPYVVGDDLRRIHWPSTARHDELLVRQQEQPWQGRTTVLLDVRRATQDTAAFEAAVSAAASVVNANGARHDLVRMVTTDGADSGFGAGTGHTQALLEHLAVVQQSSGASLRAMLDLIQRDGQGALVVVVAQTTGDELQATARLRQRYGLITVVQIDRSKGDRVAPARARSGGSGPTPAAPGAADAASGSTLVRVGPDTTFATAWDRALATSRRAGQRVGSPR